MRRNLPVIIALILVIALPFIFKRAPTAGDWREGDPVLVVISPHIAAIRQEFAQGFSAWHQENYGQPVRIDWRAIGGTTEIMRYLGAEFANAFKAYWQSAGHSWPEGGTEIILNRRFNADTPPADSPDTRLWQARAAAWKGFRATDSSSAFSSQIDVFFGGGTYDHQSAAGQGLTVPVWTDATIPPGILTDQRGIEQIPIERGGEVWRSSHFYAAALSAFGICYNPDRLRDLGIEHPPTQWEDLADPRYFGQIGVTDPTKSGSIAKAFESIVHTECHRAVQAAGYGRDDIARYEQLISAARLPVGELPPEVPAQYQAAIERGWLQGLRLLQIIGANARYFTDGAGQVAVDVSSGDAAVGISIDFYSRVQAEVTRAADGSERLTYVTPEGGSSISGDPISLLRGAPHPELARRFIEYVLSTPGQKLWNYRVGEPGGPQRYALRRMPVRREFYASTDPAEQVIADEHAHHTSDALTDPAIDVYRLSGVFEYIPRWTAPHFGFFRIMIRSMCMDAGAELRAAWQAIQRAGGPQACPVAVSLLCRLPDIPEQVTWRNAAALASGDTLDTTRQWTLFFRRSYAEATQAANSAQIASSTPAAPDAPAAQGTPAAPSAKQ